jgi:tetratricopeptide (TPR) repeat protein
MVLAALQTPVKLSSDAIDTELDEAKQELEQHQPNIARRLAERILSRHGNSLSGWQRWRAETLIANTYIAQGDLLRAGQMLIDARRHDPTGEKARINEVVGYELLGQTAKAHDLAHELRREMPVSPPVLALWIRTSPPSVPSSDVEEGAGLLVGANADVALALASLLLFRGEAGRAEPHALTATQLQPDAPQAWLLLGQAVHLRGHSAVCLAQRSELLRRAETHYAQVIALAHAKQYCHIEAGARLNRAVLRDLLGDVDHAGDDFREAIRLAPDDSDTVRRYAVFLSMHGRQDDAINEARRAVQIAPTAANEVILAGLLYERSSDGDCEEAVGLCRSMLGRDEMERLAEKYEIATACLCRLRKFSDARALLEAGHDIRLPGVCRLVLLGRTSFEEKDRPAAEQHALDAMNILTKATSTDDRRRLADLLMRLGKYSDAVCLLDGIARPGAFDETSQMLLDSAHRAKHHGVILRVCRQLREAGVDDRRVWHLETEVLSLYDRPAAIDTLQRYLR